MRSYKSLFFFVAMLCAETANADCDPQTELRDKFDYYKPFDGALRVRVSGEQEGLKLTQVMLGRLTVAVKNSSFPLKYPSG